MPFCCRVIVSCALAGALAACTTGPLLPPGSAFEVATERAPFYKYGPAQTFGADDMLARGTRLTLIQRSMGFSRVMQANGITGYISNDDISPATPEPPPKPGTVTNRKLDRLISAPVKRSNVRPTPGDPLFDVNDVPLPMKDDAPKPDASPGSADTPRTTPPPEKKAE